MMVVWLLVRREKKLLGVSFTRISSFVCVCTLGSGSVVCGPVVLCHVCIALMMIIPKLI